MITISAWARHCVEVGRLNGGYFRDFAFAAGTMAQDATCGRNHQSTACAHAISKRNIGKFSATAAWFALILTDSVGIVARQIISPQVIAQWL